MTTSWLESMFHGTHPINDQACAQLPAAVSIRMADANDQQKGGYFSEMRGWLMVVATVAASMTYQAGLNPPGGFNGWQDEGNKNTTTGGSCTGGGEVGGGRCRQAGNPVLHDTMGARYQTFYYLNSTAFVTSLVIMVLLMSERFYRTQNKVIALMLTTFIDLASLVGAYIAGSTRYMSSCIYLFVITGVAFLSVIAMGEVIGTACAFFHNKSPCMKYCIPAVEGVVGQGAGRDKNGA